MTNNLVFIFSCILVALATLAAAKNRTLLIALIAVMGVLANLFVLKQINLFGLEATASDVYAVGGLFALNVLREHHSLKACKRAILVSFCCMVFFMVMGQLHLLYQPSDLDTSQAAFDTLLTPNPRLVLASLFVFFSVQIFDIFFYHHFVRKAFKTLWIRYGFSLVISQGLDTVLFTYIGLYGLMHNLDEIMLVSLCVKLAAIVGMIPFSHLTKRVIRHGAV